MGIDTKAKISIHVLVYGKSQRLQPPKLNNFADNSLLLSTIPRYMLTEASINPLHQTLPAHSLPLCWAALPHYGAFLNASKLCLQPSCCAKHDRYYLPGDVLPMIFPTAYHRRNGKQKEIYLFFGYFIYKPSCCAKHDRYYLPG